MRRIINKLSETLVGDISVSDYDIDYYSTDGGVFELEPTAIVFPKDAVDVSNLIKTVDELHKYGNDKISLTARGNGTDQGGGPINTGIIVDFMRYMDHILEIGEDYVVVQPGCLYGRMQKELKKHGRYIPSYPASVEICTIGGAVANNAAGEKTVKYGATRDYVEAVQVVLSDGTVTWLHNASPSQVEQKKQQQDFEGDIYRQVEKLINENHDVIHNHPNVTKESSGYALWKAKNGQNLNLAQIIVGSQGTLCFVTAIRLRTIAAPDPNKVSLIVSYYDSLQKAGEAAQKLHALEPSALEIVDKNLIELVIKQKPELLQGLLPKEGGTPAVILLTEFDNQEDNERATKEHQAMSIIDQYAYKEVEKHTPAGEEKMWKLRRSAAAVMWTIPGKKKALPIIEDGTVPPHRLTEFIERAYQIFEKYDLEIAIWGHAGDADLHMQPFMDLSKVSDRKKLFAMTDEFYKMVHELGGTAAGEHNDSLMRAVYRPLMFGPELEKLFNEIKAIFDPENLLNPHKKIGVDFNYIKKHLRHKYSIESIAKLERDKAQNTIDR